jgi:hypothetical protein
MQIRFGTELMFNRKTVPAADRRVIRQFFREQGLLVPDGTITEAYRFPQADDPTEIYLSVERQARSKRLKAGDHPQHKVVRTALKHMALATAVVTLPDFVIPVENPFLAELVDEIKQHRPR